MTQDNHTEAFGTTADFLTELGKTYDDIRVLNTTGGGGVIYSGHHKRLDRRVILKQIRAEHLDTIGSRRELDLLLDLKHTYLPQIFDFWEYGKDVYTVMEFIEGSSLKEYLDTGRRFSEQEVIRFASQLAEVLSYLHASPSHIVHADIKPANIMLTPAGNICLIDFNVSATDTAADTIGYTPGYAPPEQLLSFVRCKQATHFTQIGTAAVAVPAPSDADEERTVLSDAAVPDPDATYLDDDARTCLSENAAPHADAAFVPAPAPRKKKTEISGSHSRIGKPGSLFSQLEDSADRIETAFGRRISVDVRTDIYSACATLYHLLTGKRPLPADADNKQIPVESILPRVNDAFADILEKGMANDPDARFQSADQLLSAIHKIGKNTKRYKRMRLSQDITVLLLIVLFGAGCVSAYRGGMMMLDTHTETVLAGAQTLCREGRYTEVEGYIHTELLDKPFLPLLSDTTLSDAYYFIGTGHLGAGDNVQAVAALRTAVFYASEDPRAYRDYAIALARTGDAAAADEALSQALAHGLSDENLYAVQGEILLSVGNSKEAQSAFLSCIASMEGKNAKDISADTATMLIHALLGYDTTLAADGDTAKTLSERVTILDNALQWLSDNKALTAYSIPIYERLAQTALTLGSVYAADGEHTVDAAAAVSKAAEAYRAVIDAGYATLNEYLNLSVCYQSVASLSRAMEVLTEAEKRYSDRYELYKRMAYLAFDIEEARAPIDRDYTRFLDAGRKALSLYNASGMTEDPELPYLERVIAELS